jgi:GNAT superfamily N-acetyltransferase
MPEYTVRLARAEDAGNLADFLRDLKHFRRLEDKSPEAVQSQVAALLPLCLADSSHSVYLAQGTDGEVLGYASVHWLPYLFLPGPEGYVSELFIASAARGHGIGTRLLAAVKEEARARGCSRLSLLNMRDRESYERQFYAKDGWQERADAANFVFEFQ